MVKHENDKVIPLPLLLRKIDVAIGNSYLRDIPSKSAAAAEATNAQNSVPPNFSVDGWLILLMLGWLVFVLYSVPNKCNINVTIHF